LVKYGLVEFIDIGDEQQYIIIKTRHCNALTEFCLGVLDLNTASGS